MHRWLGIGVVMALACGATGITSTGQLHGDVHAATGSRAVVDRYGSTERSTDGDTTTAARATAPGARGTHPGPPPGRPLGPPPSECEHPYPCEDVWPDGLEGPFELDRVEHVLLESHDGIQLEGWVGIPALPKGVQAPVALTSTPYLGFCSPLLPPTEPCNDTPAQERFWSDTPEGGAIRNWGVIPIELVRNGYAAAFFSVRGTGNSGGCWDLWGEDEQRDQEVIVEWLADEEENPWSNGRIGMGGLSYRAVPPVEAAVQDLEPLKTVVLAGTVFDAYSAIFTPQGALRAFDDLTLVPSFVFESALPPAGGGAEHATVDHLPVLDERACPEVLDVIGAGTQDWMAEHRNGAFWSERSFLDDLPNVTASVLLAQGFRDVLNHGFQDSPVWESTPLAPKRQITGQWAHSFPWPEVATFDESWVHSNWSETLFAWLDYWLKGEGTPPRISTADYQDGNGDWHSSTAWPPTEAAEEVLYLSSEILSTVPQEGDRTSRPAPSPLNARRSLEWYDHPVQPWAAMCPDPAAAAVGTAGLVFVSEQLDQDTLVAGNPFAYLKLSSDQPGGTVRVQVAEIVGGSTECDAAGQPSNVRVLTAGAADLRFHEGNFESRGFPTSDPAHVRVDLWDLAETISAGSRLVVAVMGAEPIDEWTGQPYQPELTIHAGTIEASQIVLPVVSGSTGGEAPVLSYPPRPFVPNLAPTRGNR